MGWLAENWANLLPVLNVTIIPAAYWLARKWDRRALRQEAHEDRRTAAAESLPQTVRELKDALTEKVRAEATLTREHVSGGVAQILEAIHAKELAEIKGKLAAIGDRLTPPPPAPSHRSIDGGSGCG